jgi:hypothetical protein
MRSSAAMAFVNSEWTFAVFQLLENSAKKVVGTVLRFSVWFSKTFFFSNGHWIIVLDGVMGLPDEIHQT